MRVCAGVSIDPYSIDKIHVHLFFIFLSYSFGMWVSMDPMGVSMGERMDVSVYYLSG